MAKVPMLYENTTYTPADKVSNFISDHKPNNASNVDFEKFNAGNDTYFQAFPGYYIGKCRHKRWCQSKGHILTGYRDDPRHAGFIFDANTNECTHIIYAQTVGALAGAINIEQLETAPGYYFVERHPQQSTLTTNSATQTFMNRYYGTHDLTADGIARGKDIRKHCMLSNQDAKELDVFRFGETTSLMEFCLHIPRCLGVVKDFCLVSTAALVDPEYTDFIDIRDSESVKDNIQYVEKSTRHRIFIYISPTSGDG
ncbi:unnamed protein product, partial [Durusdinium trenchii]